MFSICINYKCHIIIFLCYKCFRIHIVLVLLFKVYLIVAIANCNIINMRWRRGCCTRRHRLSLNHRKRKKSWLSYTFGTPNPRNFQFLVFYSYPRGIALQQTTYTNVGSQTSVTAMSERSKHNVPSARDLLYTSA